MNSPRSISDEDFFQGVITRRCLALLVDIVLIGILWLVLGGLLLLFGFLTLGLGWGAFAAMPAVPFLYHLFCLMRPASATYGQSMMGLAVRTDATLAPPDFLQALVYVVVFYATLAIFFPLLVVALFLLWGIVDALVFAHRFRGH